MNPSFASLALADGAALRALTPARAAGPGLPTALREAPLAHLAAFADTTTMAREYASARQWWASLP